MAHDKDIVVAEGQPNPFDVHDGRVVGLPPELQGDQDLAELTPKLLKLRYMPGLTLTDANGKEFDDEFYEWKIKVAIDRFEKYTHIFVKPRHVFAEPHDYIAKDYINWAWFWVHNMPVLQVHEVRAEYPTGHTITTFPEEWIRVRKEHGQIQLVPTTGTLSQVLIGRGGSYLGLLRYKVDTIPNLFKITYDAGLDNGKVPVTIIDAIGKMATIEALTDIGDALYGPGVTNISVGLDGLSQSIGLNNAANRGVFAARLNAYTEELLGSPNGDAGLLNRLRDIFRGPMLVSA